LPDCANKRMHNSMLARTNINTNDRTRNRIVLPPGMLLHPVACGDHDAGKNCEAAGRKDPFAVFRGPGRSATLKTGFASREDEDLQESPFVK
jgi:hypothetical protein